MARPFDHVLRLPGAQPEDVALAIAAEFEQVDPAAAHERLDRFAAGLGSIGKLPAGERQVMLADPSSAPTIVFDPAGRVRRPPSRIRWLCPHVIGAIMLKALATAYLERGELDRSIHALELATLLPLAGQLRARIDVRLAGIRAQLN